jgi:hypothetical protein
VVPSAEGEGGFNTAQLSDHWTGGAEAHDRIHSLHHFLLVIFAGTHKRFPLPSNSTELRLRVISATLNLLLWLLRGTGSAQPLLLDQPTSSFCFLIPFSFDVRASERIFPCFFVWAGNGFSGIATASTSPLVEP